MRSPEQIGAEEQPIGGGIGRSGWATTREQEERRVIIAAIQRGAAERQAASGAATSRLPPSGQHAPGAHFTGTSLKPLQATKRSALPGGKRAGSAPQRAGSAPRARPSGGGGGGGGGTAYEASADHMADMAALRRANKMLGAEMKRRAVEVEEKMLELKRAASDKEVLAPRRVAARVAARRPTRRHAPWRTVPPRPRGPRRR